MTRRTSKRIDSLIARASLVSGTAWRLGAAAGVAVVAVVGVAVVGVASADAGAFGSGDRVMAAHLTVRVGWS